MNDGIGKLLIIVGVLILLAGIYYTLFPKATFPPRLPGDIYIKKDNLIFYFPWVTTIVVSAILWIIFTLFYRK